METLILEETLNETNQDKEVVEKSFVDGVLTIKTTQNGKTKTSSLDLKKIVVDIKSLTKEKPNFGELPNDIFYSKYMSKEKKTKQQKPFFIGSWSAKGGVGKTPITKHLANYFGMNGYRVLIIDYDSESGNPLCDFSYKLEELRGKWEDLVSSELMKIIKENDIKTNAPEFEYIYKENLKTVNFDMCYDVTTSSKFKDLIKQQQLRLNDYDYIFFDYHPETQTKPNSVCSVILLPILAKEGHTKQTSVSLDTIRDFYNDKDIQANQKKGDIVSKTIPIINMFEPKNNNSVTTLENFKNWGFFESDGQISDLRFIDRTEFFETADINKIGLFQKFNSPLEGNKSLKKIRDQLKDIAEEIIKNCEKE